MGEIIAKVNDLFEGDLTEDDKLVYVNNVLTGKLLESEELMVQASNNTKAQFASSPTLSKEILNAGMNALAAHTAMSKQALDSDRALLVLGQPPVGGQRSDGQLDHLPARGTTVLRYSSSHLKSPRRF